MYDWKGFIKIRLNPEQEALLALALDPRDFNFVGDHSGVIRYNTIQNALFQLGALEATKTAETEFEIAYDSFFSVYFPRQEKYYTELYEYLFQNECPFKVFFQRRGTPEFIHLSYTPPEKTISTITTLPESDVEEAEKRIDGIIEWLSMMETYMNIAPPSNSIFRQA